MKLESTQVDLEAIESTLGIRIDDPAMEMCPIMPHALTARCA
jgi:hypothetical protein